MGVQLPGRHYSCITPQYFIIEVSPVIDGKGSMSTIQPPRGYNSRADSMRDNVG